MASAGRGERKRVRALHKHKLGNRKPCVNDCASNLCASLCTAVPCVSSVCCSAAKQLNTCDCSAPLQRAHAAQVLAVAKDQNGCRFLQRKFDEGGAGAIGAVLPEVLEHLIELMMDPFGNYLIQKLLDRCSEDQRLAVLQKAAEKRELVQVALNTHGTRAVQKLIETLTNREQARRCGCRAALVCCGELYVFHS